MFAWVKDSCEDQQSWQWQQFNLPSGVEELREGWQPEGNKLRGSKHITDGVFISKQFPD